MTPTVADPSLIAGHDHGDGTPGAEPVKASVRRT